MLRKKSYFTSTHMFCGAGGDSIGVSAAGGVEVRLALNHWELAIKSHNSNFPDADHDCVDVSATDPRRYYATDILWASPECTSHSLAKGKKRKAQNQLELFGKVTFDPAEERSRATMWDVPRFAEYHDYRAIIVENVVDIRYWRLWDAWLKAMQDLGYDYKCVYFNSMFAHLDPANVRQMHDFAPQSRDRIYIVFWKRGNKAPDLEFRPKGWCVKCERNVESVQSWKNGRTWGRYKRQYVYRCPTCATEVVPYHFAAANAIDWTIPAERIGDRKKPLKDKTMERIRKGLEKYGNTYLVLDVAQPGNDNRAREAFAAALPTQTARQTLAAVMPFLLSLNHSDDRYRAVTEALATQMTQAVNSLVLPMPILAALGGRQNRDDMRLVSDAMPTQTATPTFGVVMPTVIELRGTTSGMNSPKLALEEAMGTISAGGIHHGLLLQPFLLNYYGTGGDQGAVEDSLATITGTDRHALVQPMPVLTVNYSPGYSKPVTDAAATITAQDHHALVMPQPFYLGYANGDGPAHPITDPLLTMHTEIGMGVTFPSEPPAVEDCGFRMLRPHEVKRGMSFPDEYVILGSGRDIVKQCGNAVTQVVPKMLMRPIMETLQ